MKTSYVTNTVNADKMFEFNRTEANGYFLNYHIERNSRLNYHTDRNSFLYLPELLVKKAGVTVKMQLEKITE